MLLQNVTRKHPDNYVILSPAERDADGRVMFTEKSDCDRTVELGMEWSSLDEDGNLRSQDEFYIYRISDIQKKFEE